VNLRALHLINACPNGVQSPSGRYLLAVRKRRAHTPNALAMRSSIDSMKNMPYINDTNEPNVQT
jgi:hypothetical protein